MDRGKEKRCHGYSTDDGKWCFCARIESDRQDPATGLWRHLLKPDEPRTGKKQIEAIYQYVDERGALLYEAVRFIPKDFRQRRPDGNGGHVWRLEGTRRVLFHLPELLAADREAPVYITEGEKDALTAERLGLIATTNAMGAGKWRQVANHAREVLAGRDVIVFRDADDAGRKHAEQVAASLADVARSITILEAPEGKDLTDYVSAGGNLEAIQSLPNLYAPASTTNGTNGINGAAHPPPDDGFFDEAPAPPPPITIITPIFTGHDLDKEQPAPTYIAAALGLPDGARFTHIFGGYGFSGKTNHSASAPPRARR